jgi:hypothetical protein
MANDSDDDHIFVGKVKGLEPEQFIFITVAGDFCTIKRTSNAMSGDELRTALSKVGMPDWEISSHIEHARKHPV